MLNTNVNTQCWKPPELNLDYFTLLRENVLLFHWWQVWFMATQTSSTFVLFELRVCFTSDTCDSFHQVTQWERWRVKTKERIQLKGCRSHKAGATCEGFWRRVIEALLPSAEKGQEAERSHCADPLCECCCGAHVLKKESLSAVKLALFEPRRRKPGFHMARLRAAWL